MKKSELTQIIKEQIKSILNEVNDNKILIKFEDIEVGDDLEFINTFYKSPIIRGKVLDVNDDRVGFANKDYPNASRHSYTKDSLDANFKIFKIS
jgi:hypothetical protein